MSRSRPSPLAIVLFVILPSLVVYGRSSGWLDASSLAREMPAGITPQEVLAEVKPLYEAERYAEALKIFDSFGRDGDREFEFYRLANSRRLAALRAQEDASRELALSMLAFIEAEDDRWSALAVAELLRPYEREHAGALERLVPGAIRYWQESIDIDRDAVSYADLFETLLEPGVPFRAPLLEMWIHLERAPLPAARLMTLGASLLTQQSGRPMPQGTLVEYSPPHHIYYRVPDGDALRRRVATDLLKRGPEGWLRAICETTLGEIARNRAEFRDAVRHFEAAVAAESAQNSAAARMAEAYLIEITTPRAELNGPALYQPESLHQLWMSWRNLRAWELSIQSIDPNSLQPIDSRAPYSIQDFASGAEGEHAFGMTQTDQEEADARKAAGGAQPYVARSKEIWIDPLPNGLYRATLRGKTFDEAEAGPVSTTLFAVTELGILMQNVGTPEKEELELWLVNMRTGEPLPGASLRVLLGVGQRAEELVWREETFRCGADGAIRVALPKARQRSLLATARVGGQPVFLAHAGLRQSFVADSMQDACYLLSDRPLYRPGETVQLQGFLRKRDSAQRRVSLPEGHGSAWLFVHGANGAELLRRELELDANGSIETGFDLPADASLGRYSLQIRWQESSRVFGAGSIQVDEVRLPEFRLSTAIVTVGTPVVGDTIGVDLSAEYLFGGAVSGAGEVIVRRGATYMPMDGVSYAMPYPPARFAMEEIWRGAIVLDGTGRAHFEFVADAGAQAADALEFVVEARVTDSSRREVVSQSSLRLGHAEFMARLQPTRWVVAPGDRARVDLELLDFSGNPVAGRVQMQALHFGRSGEQSVEDKTIEVSASGAASFEFEPKLAGQHRVLLTAKDGRGHEISAQCVVWCADPNRSAVVEGEGGITLVAERDTFEGEGPARVLLFSSYPDAAIQLVRAHGGAVISEILRLDGSMKVLEFPLDALHRPSFQLRASLAHDFRLWISQIEIQTPPAEQRLDLALEFDREVYGPGDEAALRVSVRDRDGRPARGPVTISVIDAAILEVMPRGLQDPLLSFFSFAPTRIAPAMNSAQQLGGFRFFDEKYVDDVQRGLGTLGEAGAKRSRVERSDELAFRGGDTPAAEPAFAQSIEEKAVGGREGVAPSVEVRRDFRSTALWRAAVFADADGSAELRFRLPDSLTEWNALGLGIDAETRCGVAEATTKTHKSLQLRLNHARVFREKDRVLFAGTVHNDSDADLVCTVSLSADPLVVEQQTRDLIVAAHSQGEVAWWADVPDGSARLDFERDADTGRLTIWPDRCLVRASLRSSKGSDAFEKSVELIPHGTPLDLSATVELKESGVLLLELPDARVPGAERASLTLAPSVLSTCFGALSFLAQYPYGCTEQTLSRFVPAAAVRRVAQQFGKSAKNIDPALDDKIQSGLRRIADFQHGDGGWGWWKEDVTDPYMTSYVLIALAEASHSGVRVDRGMFTRGRAALRNLLSTLETRPDDLAYAMYALTAADGATGVTPGADDTMLRYSAQLFEKRSELSDSTRALLALYLNTAGQEERAAETVAFLKNTVVEDDDYGTAHWGMRTGYHRRSEGAVEATAFVLRALLSIAPEDPLVDATARWLVQNRRGNRWDNTRATAHTIYALCEFSAEREKIESSFDLRATIGDFEIASLHVDPDTIFDLDWTFYFDPSLLVGERAAIRIEMTGDGVCYASALLSTYSKSDDPQPTEHWLGVRRELYRLVPTPTLGGGYRNVEERIEDGTLLVSGERIRVKLDLSAHAEVDYVAIEDPRLAGAEPVDALSGWFQSNSLSGRREIRDEQTAFFIGQLAEGQHVIEYELRVESPGLYHALPARAYAMYLPDVSGSSAMDVLSFVAFAEAPTGP